MVVAVWSFGPIVWLAWNLSFVLRPSSHCSLGRVPLCLLVLFCRWLGRALAVLCPWWLCGPLIPLRTWSHCEPWSAVSLVTLGPVTLCCSGALLPVVCVIFCAVLALCACCCLVALCVVWPAFVPVWLCVPAGALLGRLPVGPRGAPWERAPNLLLRIGRLVLPPRVALLQTLLEPELRCIV